MAEKGVKVFGMWASAFALRVEWALKLKGVEYEYVSENLPHNKSPELLHYNPITKKIPVLVHEGKAIIESLVIVEYIDDTWKDGHPIMPKDPYEKAQARFWAKFSEDKCLPAIFAVYSMTGEEQLKAIEEAKENLKTLEVALKGNKFFGGDTIGYLDIAIGWIPYWLRMIEELAGVTVMDDQTFPLINAWFNNFLDVELIKEKLPPKDKLYEFNQARREEFLSGQLSYKV